jgi:hypothetical protein
MELLPGACTGLDRTAVLNEIASSDLTFFATTKGGIDLYTLKDPNHPLNHAMYFDKITNVNRTSTPTFAQYVAKNPVLVFKDPWGRWIGVGEFDYPIIGGCGKPVIYLYPPKPVEVSVRFLNPVHFTTDIPTYASKWDVMAYPDGKLIDLQPEFTACAAIDSTRVGSEYEASACDHNDYPYLYWAGQVGGLYPTPHTGWIVPRDRISNFLRDKLTIIGFSEKERGDMMEYWVPELLRKEAPYYRISFFETATMDRFIPMEVSPRPDTVIRIFLDWTPLSSLPAVQLEPEVLHHVKRSGFTMVEWGGLKQ